MASSADAAFVGVDVGGTKVSAARMSGGELTERSLTDTAQGSVEELVDGIVGAVERVGGAGFEAVGVGVPSTVDFETGRARASVNVPLEDFPLRRVLRDRLGLPVYVDNDTTLAALAEAYEGGALAARNLVMFTVGTGVGGGLVLNGSVYRGATGAAPEIGHMLIAAELADGAPPAGEFPQRGSLESLAAGTALDGLAAEAARTDPDSALGRIASERGEVNGRDAVEVAEQGDERARRVIAVLGERLGIGIANAINTFDPDVVAIGGGVSAAGDLLLGPAIETAHRFVLPGVGTKTEIRLARHGPEAGVLGAALLAQLELESESGDAASERGGT